MKLSRKTLRRLIFEEIEGDLAEKPKRVIAIYPGRFQPMGRHHKATYDWIVNTFGAENSYVVTSDKVCLPDSPLCFTDKQKVASAMGIPSDKVSFERVVYAPKTFGFMKSFDPETTAVVVVVGEKDMRPSFDPKSGGVEQPRFVKGKNLDGVTKKGKPGYYRTYVPGAALEGYDKHGYVMAAPHQNVDVGGKEMSGSELRRQIPGMTDEEFKMTMGFSDEEIASLLRDKFRR
jgi:hypothetical protein